MKVLRTLQQLKLRNARLPCVSKCGIVHIGVTSRFLVLPMKLIVVVLLLCRHVRTGKLCLPVYLLSFNNISEVLLASGAEPFVATAFPVSPLNVGPSVVSPLSARLGCRPPLCARLRNGATKLPR